MVPRNLQRQRRLKRLGIGGDHPNVVTELHEIFCGLPQANGPHIVKGREEIGDEQETHSTKLQDETG
jgi:hypothetical protein